MVKITLTAAQKVIVEPLEKEAYATGGSVFCQARRGTSPEHEQIFIGCHFIPAESAKRLRAWLAKERQRIDAVAQKAAAGTEKEGTV